MDGDVVRRAFSNCSLKLTLSGCFFESTSLVEGLLDLLLFFGGGDSDADDDELIIKLLTRLTLAYLLIN